MLNETKSKGKLTSYALNRTNLLEWNQILKTESSKYQTDLLKEQLEKLGDHGALGGEEASEGARGLVDLQRVEDNAHGTDQQRRLVRLHHRRHVDHVLQHVQHDQVHFRRQVA